MTGHGVRRLLVFGSAVRDDFDQAASEVDFGLKEDLVLWRHLDLVSSASLENRYLARSVANDSRELCAA